MSCPPDQLDAKYPPDRLTHRAAWRSYNEDMGNDPERDGGTPDPTGGTTCAHPAIGGPDKTIVATPVDQFAMRHSPFLWFRSTVDNQAECDANVVHTSRRAPSTPRARTTITPAG